jgi:hypothetical protein
MSRWILLSVLTLVFTRAHTTGPLPDTLASLKTVNTAYFDGNPALVCPVGSAVTQWLSGVAYHADLCRNSTR